MIVAICLIAIGAFGALYFTHESFRDRVNDLVTHVRDLFKSNSKDEPVILTTTAPATFVVTPPSGTMCERGFASTEKAGSDSPTKT